MSVCNLAIFVRGGNPNGVQKIINKQHTQSNQNSSVHGEQVKYILPSKGKKVFKGHSIPVFANWFAYCNTMIWEVVKPYCNTLLIWLGSKEPDVVSKNIKPSYLLAWLRKRRLPFSSPPYVVNWHNKNSYTYRVLAIKTTTKWQVKPDEPNTADEGVTETTKTSTNKLQ